MEAAVHTHLYTHLYLLIKSVNDVFKIQFDTDICEGGL